MFCKNFLLIAFFLYSALIHSQTGPGGVGNTSGSSTLRVWVRADAGVTLASGKVSQWNDRSGYNNHLTMPTAANQPSFASNVFNGLPAVQYIGTSSNYFDSGFNGPNSNDITIFLFAKGSSYQSLVRYQNQGGVYLVYPWEVGGGRTFITSSDGGTGNGLASGLVSGVKNLGTARYDRNTTTSGFQTFLNGSLVAQRTSVNSALPNEPFYSGRYNPGTSEYPTADVSEIIIFYSAVNEAQRIIIENYLAAKYDTLLTSNDVYTMDNSSNGNYDYDVAGIGRTSLSSTQTDSRGTGVVRISGASGLGNNEFFMWGKNSAVVGATTAVNMPTVAPQSLQTRWAAEWRVSESGGDVGTVDISFDLTGFTPVTAANLRLLIDTDNDGSFTDEVNNTGVISGANSLGSNVYEFSNINIADGRRFTLGSVNKTNTTLPVTLIDFSGNSDGHQVVLNWATASEENNKLFHLYRSQNAEDWELIGTINGQNFSQQKNTYEFIDAQAKEGLNYYRLEDQDNIGQSSFSKTIAVNIAFVYSENNRIYPNPSPGIFFIRSPQAISTYNVRLTDLYGKEHGCFVNKIFPDIVELETRDLAPGIYLLHYSINYGSPETAKISILAQE